MDPKGIFRTYIKRHHKNDMVSILTSTDTSLHYSVIVNVIQLMNFDSNLWYQIHTNPIETLSACNKTIKDLQRYLIEKEKENNAFSFKDYVEVRMRDLPLDGQYTRYVVPSTSEVGKLLSFRGTVIRTSPVKILEKSKMFKCKKCRQTFNVEADFEQCFLIAKPVSCPQEGCNSFKLALHDEEMGDGYHDYQEIKLQEHIQRLDVGSIPRSVMVILEKDLVDKCKVGDDVTLTGIIRQQWKPLSIGGSCTLSVVIQANDVLINNEDRSSIIITPDIKDKFNSFWSSYDRNPLEGRNFIISSFCPQICGMYIVKLSIILAIIGGVQFVDTSGTCVRGDCHLLLVGDPGTGKSQFLKFASRLSARSVLTTGIGTTSAGLTVTAVKDGGEWQLEPGALVLADCGICCVDEFNSISEHDRASIHEAMEQQTISVAKAGLVCKLNSRCSVLATANAKGTYDVSQSVGVNVALASPLLSRFDLVLVLRDTTNDEWDKLVSKFILSRSKQRDQNENDEQVWSLDELKAYINLVKSLEPTITPTANQILRKYYQLQRQTDSRDAARTTVRLLESLVRLSQAHARLMYRDKVMLQDAVMAIVVMECSMQGGSIIASDNEGPSGIDVMHIRFPEDVKEEYNTQEMLVLDSLNLSHLKQDDNYQQTQSYTASESHTDTGPDPVPPQNQTQQQTSNVTHSWFDVDDDDDILEAHTDTGPDPVPPQNQTQQQTSNVTQSWFDVDDDDDILEAHTDTGPDPVPPQNQTQQQTSNVTHSWFDVDDDILAAIELDF